MSDFNLNIEEGDYTSPPSFSPNDNGYKYLANAIILQAVRDIEYLESLLYKDRLFNPKPPLWGDYIVNYQSGFQFLKGTKELEYWCHLATINYDSIIDVYSKKEQLTNKIIHERLVELDEQNKSKEIRCCGDSKCTTSECICNTSCNS